MLFLTYWFVFFIAALYPIYWFCSEARAPALVLLVGKRGLPRTSREAGRVLPVIVLGTFVYLVGLSGRRWLCYTGIAASCLSLVYYKPRRSLPRGFSLAVYPDAAEYVTAEQRQFRAITAPLAISFFVFEFVHYLVDVCRGGKPIRNILDFTLFTVFWPSIVAGPVRRYQQFFEAVHIGTTGVNSQDVAVGVTRVAIGLVKKFRRRQPDELDRVQGGGLRGNDGPRPVGVPGCTVAPHPVGLQRLLGHGHRLRAGSRHPAPGATSTGRTWPGTYRASGGGGTSR